MADKPKLWFRAKQYGWGWHPATMQGWLCVGGYVLAVLVGSARLTQSEPETYPPVMLYLGWVLFCSVVLGVISYKKGEKPGLRWGK